MTPQLTIAIPTFDRNALLREHVAVLLPQLTNEVRLLILDNASPTPVAESLASLPLTDRVRLVRHRVNVGSSANVMRCVELCETPWLWVLGDDDRPLPDAVTTALKEIDRHSDCLVINFASMHQTVSEELVTRGVEEFITRTPSLANLTLISSNLLRADWLSPHVRTGCFFAYSLYPHYACMLAALTATGAACCFSPRRLVEWGPTSEWSRITAGLGAGMLLDLPLPPAARRRMTAELTEMCGRYSSLTILLLDQIGRTMDAPTARHLYDQAWHRLYKYEWSISRRLMRCVGISMLTFPKLGRLLYRTYRRLRGYPSGDGGSDIGRL